MTSAGKVIAGIALGLAVLSGCGDGGASCDPIAATLVSRIEVQPPTASMANGASLQLEARAFSCDGSQLALPPVQWSSADAATVSVSGMGMAQGLRVGGPVAVTATAQGKEGVAQLTVVPPPPTRVAFAVQPSDVVAGVSFNPAILVEILDAFGNRVTSATATVTLSLGNNPGGAALSGVVTASAVNGVATFDAATLNRTGSGYTLTADSPGLAGATSASFSVTPASASKLAFAVQPTSIAEGVPFDPVVVVELQDAFGNRVTTAVGTVTLTVRSSTGGNPPSGTTLVGGGARGLSQGAAVYTGMTVNISVQRTLTLRATSTGFASVLSQTFVVRPF